MADLKSRKGGKFSLSKPIKISSELYNIDKYRWKMSTLGYRTLFAISQCVDGNMLFREVSFPKDMLFKYLGLESTNRRYELLKDALNEVRQSGVEYCSVNERGKRKWVGISWITFYSFSEEDNTVNIDINDKAMPFLCALKQYALIQPKTYLRLSTDYQNWLYPLLKMRLGLGSWEMTIDYIYESLDLEHTKSYNKKNRNYIVNILKYVVGIQISDAAKKEQKLATKERRKPKLVAWDYVKNSNGKPSGTLYAIHKETDINVYACAVKEGRSYNKVIFFISEKVEKMSSVRKQRLHEEVVSAAESDMGKIQDRKNRGGETLFSGWQESKNVSSLPENQNPAFIPDKVEASPVFYNDSDLESLICPELGLNTLQDVADKAGYRKHPNGLWYKT